MYIKKEKIMIIYAREIADQIKSEIKEEVSKIKGRLPKLVVILAGENQASQKYVNAKHKACNELGINSEIIQLEESCSEETLLLEIDRLNHDATVDGILVQLPLPKHINVDKVLDSISADKDVDGFHPIHLGNLLSNKPSIIPCTPKGIMKFFEFVNYDLTGKNVVIIGRSTIVSKPLVHLFLQQDATVTITHSKTRNLEEVCRNADVVVAAVGRAKMINENYIKEGAFVIDVGINVDENGKLCGDVDFDRVVSKVGYITPVPKGVGVMTITMLLRNTIELYKKHIQ